MEDRVYVMCVCHVPGPNSTSTRKSPKFFWLFTRLFVSLRQKHRNSMRHRILFIFSIAIIAFMGCATQQEKAERRELMRKAVTEAVAKKEMRIEIISMNAMRYGNRNVSADFFLELHGDSVRSYLPYLGVAHQAPMMSPGIGLNFDTRAISIKESHPKADLSRLEIDLRTSEDRYLYAVELYDSGKAYIHVSSQNRDPISFDGELVTTKEK